MDIRRTKSLMDKVPLQWFLFWFLYAIGFVFDLNCYYFRYRFKYARYCFTHARLAELQTTLVDGCSNLTNLPCSLQMTIDVYFLWSKFLIIYYLSIIIGMIYTWHRSVCFSHCVITLFIVSDILFHTDLFLYFDQIVLFTSFVCVLSLFMLFSMECTIPHDSHDQLRTFCKIIALPDVLDEDFFEGPSKLARFYRWATKMKIQWNIQEEKLVFTFIIQIIICISTMIVIYFFLDRW